MAELISGDLTKTASQIVQEELEALRQRIIANMVSHQQPASGRTVKSLDVTVNDGHGILWNRANGIPFIEISETGRKPGKVPYHFATIIYNWMVAKGIHGDPMPYKTLRPHKYDPQTRGDLSMASAIAYTIKTKGTLLHRTGNIDIYSTAADETVATIGDRLMQLIERQMRAQVTLHNQTIK
jgi:hypothetical protein